MKSKALLIIAFLSYHISYSQDKAFDLLSQRLEDLRQESSLIEKKRDELLGKVESLKSENKRLKRDANYYRKQLKRNEVELEAAIKKLFDTQNNLILKMAEVSVLSQQIALLQSKNDSLRSQVRILSEIKDTLKTNLDSTKAKLAALQKEYNAVTQSAKIRSAEHSLSNPHGYRPKKFSVYLVDGGFNVGQGFAIHASIYTFLIPTRSIILGLNVGYDNYSADNNDSYSGFSLIPISLSWRGRFKGLDLFQDSDGEDIVNFNPYYILEAGGSLAIRDTKQAENISGNVFFNVGVGALRPIWNNVGINLSATLLSQRILVSDINDDKFGINRFALALRFGFMFKF
ncbi:MAG: hypothetical protein DYG98_27110 [Haliscomenobacteraceae bacterium CHB4]|nr:hypothetical protein [Haliscomenobacteraceae bacterium CHB4]